MPCSFSRRRFFMLGILAVLTSAPFRLVAQATARDGAGARQGVPASVLLISIDGLRPEYVLDSATFGGRLPHLRRMVRDGAFATGVRGVVPTVTYPSHATLLTGVSPAKHGILANTTFDPMLRNQGGWYWYASDIRVPTLWDAARGAGLRTASVHWPVSVGAPIDVNLPQYWRAGTPDDRKLIRVLSTPGLLDRLERELGPYADGADETIEGDENRARFAARILELERPRFMTTYFTALDHEQHERGPLGPANRGAMLVLERIDAIVGRLTEAATRTGGTDAVVAVVSDHGFAPAARELNLFPALLDAGLISADSSGHVTAWEASIWPAGGSVAVVVKDTANAAARRRVREVMQRLAADASMGIERLVEPDELARRGAFTGVELLLALRPGFTSGSKVISTLLPQATVRGMHGYWPDEPSMRSAFFIRGNDVPRGRSLGEIDMRSIAPTLASLLGVTLSMAEQPALFAHAGSR
jgi:predicted AlkP superfamily pyrophosphatase or phosphodiesterase